jgi:hypothetical protein
MGSLGGVPRRTGRRLYCFRAVPRGCRHLRLGRVFQLWSDRRFPTGLDSPVKNRGPEPRAAATSSGLKMAHERNDKHPHPMQSPNSSRSSSSLSMRLSSSPRQARDILAQSFLFGTRPPGSWSRASLLNLGRSLAWDRRRTAVPRMRASSGRARSERPVRIRFRVD